MNVVVLGDGPVTPGGLDLIEMHRVLGTETSEMLLPPVLPEKVRIRRVDRGEVEISGRRDTGTDLGHLHLGCAHVGLCQRGKLVGLGHPGSLIE